MADPIIVSSVIEDFMNSATAAEARAAIGATNTVTAAQIAALDFSILPTANPGSGRLWLNGGVLQVGA